jgi:hypothetical protein
MTITRRPIPKVSWIILTVVGVTALLAGLYVLFATPSNESMFVGLYASSFSLLSVLVTVTAFRWGQRWAWFAMCLPVAIYGITAASMLISQSSVGYTYLAYAAVTLVGLLIPVGRFFSSAGEESH